MYIYNHCRDIKIILHKFGGGIKEKFIFHMINSLKIKKIEKKNVKAIL